MIILSQIYNAFASCCCRKSTPAKPQLPSNESIQARLASLDVETSDAKRSAFWDSFTSMDDEGSSNFQLESLPPAKGDHAYDLGAGVGNNTRFLLSRGWKVTAVDISPKALAILNSQKNKNLEAIESPLETFNFSKKANLIIATDVLAFCQPSKVKNLWDRMHGALNEGGYLLCTLPTPAGGNFAHWDMSRNEISQFLLEGKYKVMGESESDDPYTDHPLHLVLKKV